MTNESAPYGFKPVQMRNGSPWTGKTQKVLFLASYAVATFNGDMVKFTGTAAADPIDPDSEYPVVEIADPADTRLAGAIVRHEPDRGDSGFINHRLASTLRAAYIPMDRDVIYSVMEDSDGGNLAATDAEANIDFVAGAGGSTVSGTSGQMLDSSTANTTSSLPLRLLGIENKVGNTYGAFGQYLVTINQDAYNSTTGL